MILGLDIFLTYFLRFSQLVHYNYMDLFSIQMAQLFHMATQLAIEHTLSHCQEHISRNAHTCKHCTHLQVVALCMIKYLIVSCDDVLFSLTRLYTRMINFHILSTVQ